MGQIKNIKLHIVTDIKYTIMSSAKSENVRRKKKKFLMGVENQWLIEDNLMSVYGHLVESYSEQLREEWKVKDEVTSNVKQEVEDEVTLSDQSSSTNPPKDLVFGEDVQFNRTLHEDIPT